MPFDSRRYAARIATPSVHYTDRRVVGVARGLQKGIDVFVHPTFWLLPLLILFTSGGATDRATVRIIVN